MLHENRKKSWHSSSNSFLYIKTRINEEKGDKNNEAKVEQRKAITQREMGKGKGKGDKGKEKTAKTPKPLLLFLKSMGLSLQGRCFSNFAEWHWEF
jgi:hypothetical protein